MVKDGKVKQLPNRITLYILIPVITAGMLFTVLMVSILVPRLRDYFFERTAHSLEMAADTALKICDENMRGVMELRLEKDQAMISTIHENAIDLIEQTAGNFPDMKIFIIENENKIVSVYPQKNRDPSPFKILPKKSYQILSFDLMDETYLGCTRYFPFFRWKIVSAVPEEKAFALLSVIRLYIYIILFTFILFMSVTFLTAFYITVKRPLVKLMNTADVISTGTMKKIDTSRTDEMGRVIEAFNNMVNNLDKNRSLQEESLREKESLLQEIHHRVKNNLNIVISLLNLQKDTIRTTEDARNALSVNENRVYSMALVHESLYQSESISEIDMDIYINTLVSHLSNIYMTNSRIDIDVNVESIRFNINKAAPCGLLLNELVTNAFTHAFPENREGRINIVLRRNEDESCTLEVQDNGQGLPRHFDYKESDSLGVKLIHILTEQLGGSVTVISNGGTLFSVHLPFS